MPLKLTLKPEEKVIIGGAVIRNNKTSIEFTVENQVPILREKDILTDSEADTICKKIYLLIQLMYIDGENIARYQNSYLDLIKFLVREAPKTLLLIEQINELILSNRYYHALKKAKKLIKYEEEVLKNNVKD
ncbi:MAG TPA: flagellar protein FlbT [Nitrospirae bacterium]|nr:flagellar protein FlbT [Nitrospirota bacterium]